MAFITSPQFKTPIEEVIDRSLRLQRMVKDEFADHVRTWKKRWAHYQVIIMVLKVLPLQLPASTNSRQ